MEPKISLQAVVAYLEDYVMQSSDPNTTINAIQGSWTKSYCLWHVSQHEHCKLGNCFEFNTFNIFYVLGNNRNRETSTGNRLPRNYNTLPAITLSMILPRLLLHRMLPLPPPLPPALSWNICWPDWIRTPSNKCLISWINPSAGYWKVRNN